MKKAKFFVGQIIHHKLFNYRGVIYDVDYHFLGGEEWYEKVARSRPSKNQPWYHVLVDNATHRTYVAECNLTISDNHSPINNPLLEQYFNQHIQGIYRSNTLKN
ncbi:MAG: heat shock protein HspQ [Gammaproteobacteria bacterium]